MTKTIKIFTLLSIFLFGEISYADIPIIYDSKLGTPTNPYPTIKTTAKGFKRCGREKVKIKENLFLSFQAEGIENPTSKSSSIGNTIISVSGFSENFEIISNPIYKTKKTILNYFTSTDPQESYLIGVIRYSYPKKSAKFAIPGVITLSPRKVDTYSDLTGKLFIKKGECTLNLSFGKFRY